MNLRRLSLFILALVTGCSSAPTRYYTLVADSSSPVMQPASVNFELQAVRVPLQNDQPQLVVRRASHELAILDHERWAAPLADEFHDALADQLERQFGRRDLAGMPKPAGIPVVRVSTDVRRFESVEGQQAVLDAVWNLRLSEPHGGTRNLTCSSTLRKPAEAGIAGVVYAHQQAVAELAQLIAQTSSAWAANPSAECPSPPPGNI